MTNQNWNDPAGSQPSPEPQQPADQSQPSVPPQPSEAPGPDQGPGSAAPDSAAGQPTYGYTPPTTDYNAAPSYGPTPGYADASGYTPPTSQPSAGQPAYGSTPPAQPSYGYTPPSSQPSAEPTSYGYTPAAPYGTNQPGSGQTPGYPSYGSSGQPDPGYVPPTSQPSAQPGPAASQPSADQPGYGYTPPPASTGYGAPGYPATPGYAAPTGPEGGYGYIPTTDPSAASYGAGSTGYTTPTADYGQSQPAGYGTPGYGAGGGYDAYGQPAQPAYGQDPNAYGQPAQPPYGQAGYGQDPNAYGGGYPQQSVNPYGYDSGYASAAPALSTWGRRVLGALLDYVAPAAAAGIIGSIFGSIVSSDSVGSAVYWVLFVAFVIWNTVLQGGRTGLTIGRKVAKTKLVSEETGQPIGPGMALLRQIAHFVDSVICYIGWLFPLWDSKRQTIADKIVKTVVIDTDGPVAR